MNKTAETRGISENPDTITHLRDSHNHGTPYGTVAYTCYEDGIRYGIALCNPHDAFVKVTGRNKASGRFRSNEAHKFIKHDDATKLTHVQVMELIMDDVEHVDNFLVL